MLDTVTSNPHNNLSNSLLLFLFYKLGTKNQNV